MSDIWFSFRWGAGGPSKVSQQGEQPRNAYFNWGGSVKEEWREPCTVAVSLAAIRAASPERIRADWTSKTGKAQLANQRRARLSDGMLVDRWVEWIAAIQIQSDDCLVIPDAVIMRCSSHYTSCFHQQTYSLKDKSSMIRGFVNSCFLPLNFYECFSDFAVLYFTIK